MYYLDIIVERFFFQVRLTHPWVCRIHTFMVYWLAHVCSWLIVGMTWQRTVVILCPFNLALRDRMNNCFAYGYVTIVPMLLAGMNVYFLVTHDILLADGAYRCTGLPEYETFSRAVRWVDLVFASILPFFLILIGNVLIIYRLVRSRKKRKHITKNNPGQKGLGMTAVLLIISFTFLITTLPISVYLTSIQFFQSRSPLMRLLSTIFMFLSYVNNCINFYLYIISGKKFRKELAKMLGCKKSRFTNGSHTSASYSVIGNSFVMTNVNHSAS